MRKRAIELLVPYFRSDPTLRLLVEDCGFAAIDPLCDAYPGRVLNMGIMEGATVGIAAGMALSGLRPIVYGIAQFLLLRAAEQIALDVVEQELPVKFIGVGTGDYFKALGKSHVCKLRDINLCHTLGLPWLWPTVYDSADAVIEEFVKTDQPCYLRL